MEEKSNKRIAQIINWIFLITMIAMFTYFIVGEIILPAEGEISRYSVELLDVHWELVSENGDRMPIEVPGECDIEAGTDCVIETTLPENLGNLTWLSFRSMMQEMDIYIDGQLRQSYNTNESRPFGKNSTKAYVFVKINSDDSGKILRVVTRSDSKYSGVIGEVYIGDRLDVWLSVWKQQGYKLVIAVILISLSVITILISFVLKIFYKRKVVLNYLGWGIIYATIWVVSESQLRQIVFPNYSVVSNMGYFSIMLLPLPFIVYMNSLQKGRYHRLYAVLTGVIVCNLLVCTGLQLTNKVDFLDTLFLMHIILGVSFLLAGATMICDLRKKLLQEYMQVALGMIGVLLASCVEIFLVNRREERLSGVVLCISLLCLLGLAAYSTGKDIFRIEREKQRAVVSGEARILFLANMSHEIRTPINTIIGMNDVIMRENKDENIKEYLDYIQNASQMLLALVNDVLDFSKIDSGNMELENYMYHPASMLNDLVHILQMKASQKKLDVRIYMDRNIPSILKGDEIRVKQIITNLLTNAVKYTEEGRVVFSVVGVWNEKSEFFLEISVSDTGKGIPEDELDKLFDKFARLDQKKNRHVEGTGLGLSITKLLVERMNGQIRVKSTYGKGSIFIVKIPQEVVQLEPMGDMFRAYKEELETEEQYEQTIYIPGASILVVDDNEMNLTVFKALLQNTGICIDTALSGRDALRICREKKFDLIFMDHMMPDIDGIETLHLLKKDSETLNLETTVIALTANALSGSKEKYITEGFDDYFSKPIEVEKLEHLLMQYLGDMAVDISQKQLIEQKNATESEKEKENIAETLVEQESSSEVLIEPEDESESMEEKIASESTESEETAMNTQDIGTNDVAQIDQELGVQYCAGSREIYISMLDIFIEQVDKYMAELPEFFEKKDWKNYAIAVHALKSTSLTIGAKNFSEKAKEQELAAKGENVEFLSEQWETFMQEYRTVVEAVQTIIEAERK